MLFVYSIYMLMLIDYFLSKKTVFLSKKDSFLLHYQNQSLRYITIEIIISKNYQINIKEMFLANLS